MRDELGVFYAESLGYLVVTEISEIERIFTDHETFASVNVQDPVFGLAPEAQAVLEAEDFDPVAVMSNRSEPDHGRIRVYTRAGFSNRRIKTLVPYVRRRCHELIDSHAPSGSTGGVRQGARLSLARRDRVSVHRVFPKKTTSCSKDGAVTARRSRGVNLRKPNRWRSPSRCWHIGDIAGTSRRRSGGNVETISPPELIGAHETKPDDISYHRG